MHCTCFRLGTIVYSVFSALKLKSNSPLSTIDGEFEQIVVYYFKIFMTIQSFLYGCVNSKQVNVALQVIYDVIYIN